MHFLAEIMSSHILNIKDKTPGIVSQIGRLKCEVKKYMEYAHIDLKVMKERSNHLLEEANRLNAEMKILNEEVEHLTEKELDESTADLINLIADLKETMVTLKIVTQLVEINDLFKKFEDCMRESKYFDASKSIRAVKEILNNISDDEQLDIIHAIVTRMNIAHDSLLNETMKLWTELVSTDKQVTEELVCLKIEINFSRADDLRELIKSLCFENKIILVLHCLSIFLIDEIFTSVINHTCEVETPSDDIYSTLTIKVKQNSEKQTYTKVFENIQIVLEFLFVTINFDTETNTSLLEYIGQKISKQFCDLLIKNCLVDTVPSTPEGLEDYKAVVVEIEDLQNILVTYQFFNNDNKSILEYANNVDVLFANKLCQTYLNTARSILKKDLHDMVEAGTDVDPNDSSRSTFAKCCISRSTNEYLDLVRTMLDQASASSDLCTGRLVYTVEQIIGYYLALIPKYHQKLLDTIPQQVALFHNNCLYIANELITINKFYKNMTASLAVVDESFIRYVQLLRTSGTNALLKNMRTQTQQIEIILKDSELTKLGQSDTLDPNCEKSIRQCLRQLELLKTVWQKVLSYEIYNKTIGELLNSFVDNLINIVIGVEDISADSCTFLVDVYTIVMTRGPKLFTEPKEINLYTKHWYKFNELFLLLNSSLVDINDRWADGKGPLAVEFKADEVKDLIRALFQNTDRRSAVLARIPQCFKEMVA